MSLQAITASLALRGFSSSEKLMLIAWANYADENFKCYPSQRRLAEDTGLSERQIRTIAASLEHRGCIHRLERRRPDGSRSTDIITLLCLYQQAEVTSGGVRKSLPGGGEVTSGQNLSLKPEGSKEPISTPKRASRKCPEDWKPTELDEAVGRQEGLDPSEVTRCLAMFKDHTFGASRVDWSASFRNWLRKAGDQKRRDGRFSGKGTVPTKSSLETPQLSAESLARLDAIRNKRRSE